MNTDASNLISNFNDIVSGWPFWTGFGSVMLFSLSRFNVTLPDIDELSPPLRPRSFTTAFRFWLAAFVYVGCYASLYLALLAVGSVPQLLEVLDPLLHTPVTPTIGTAVGAALATLVLPALPWINSIDGWIRVRLQDFAGIPSKARMVAREVLAALDEAEPAPINNRSTLRQIAAAISAHRARFDQLWRALPKLQNSADALAGPRFAAFFRDNEKIMEGFMQEFSSELPKSKIMDDAYARYIEQKYRSGVKKVARFMVCSMLDAESTEFRVRGHWRSLGFKVEPGGLDFQLKNIITSLFGISLAVIISCYLSVTLYYLIHTITGYYDVGAPLSKILSDNTYLFLRWSVVTVLIYIPPITVAAGTAMYLLDQTSSGANLTFTDYATAAVLTFTASAILCFFVLLAYGVLYPTLVGETPQSINRLAPWTIPAALVATTFMLLSSCPRSANAELSESHFNVLSLSVVAMLGGLFAHFLSGPPPQDRIGSLPAGSFIYLVAIAPACVGACLGRLLPVARHTAKWRRPEDWIGHWSERYGKVLAHALGLKPPITVSAREQLNTIAQPFQEALYPQASSAEFYDRDGKLLPSSWKESVARDFFGRWGLALVTLTLLLQIAVSLYEMASNEPTITQDKASTPPSETKPKQSPIPQTQQKPF